MALLNRGPAIRAAASLAVTQAVREGNLRRLVLGTVQVCAGAAVDALERGVERLLFGEVIEPAETVTIGINAPLDSGADDVGERVWTKSMLLTLLRRRALEQNARDFAERHGAPWLVPSPGPDVSPEDREAREWAELYGEEWLGVFVRERTKLRVEAGDGCDDCEGAGVIPAEEMAECEACGGTGSAQAGDVWRGHAIVEHAGVWVYADTGTAVSAEKDRPCGHCRLPNLPSGHDACLGELPGVRNACCGHGDAEGGTSSDGAYVQFSDGRRLDGEEALRWARSCRNEAKRTIPFDPDRMRIDGGVVFHREPEPGGDRG